MEELEKELEIQSSIIEASRVRMQCQICELCNVLAGIILVPLCDQTYRYAHHSLKYYYLLLQPMTLSC